MYLERLWGAKVPSISRNPTQRAPNYADRRVTQVILSTERAHSVDNLRGPGFPPQARGSKSIRHAPRFHVFRGSRRILPLRSRGRSDPCAQTCVVVPMHEADGTLAARYVVCPRRGDAPGAISASISVSDEIKDPCPTRDRCCPKFIHIFHHLGSSLSGRCVADVSNSVSVTVLSSIAWA